MSCAQIRSPIADTGPNVPDSQCREPQRGCGAPTRSRWYSAMSASAAVPPCPRVGARHEAVLAPLELGEGGADQVAAGQPQLGRAVDRRGHPAQGLAVLVAVLAHPDVHLGERVQAHGVQGVDEHAQLDAVADREGQPFQQRAAGRVLAAERLDEAGQLRPVQVEQRAGHQFGDPAAAGRPPCRRQRAVVHRLDELHAGSVSSGPTIPETKSGGEVPQVGVDEADDVAAGDQQRAPQHLALAGQGGHAAAVSSSRCTTRAPAAAATSAVRSVEPESITTSSSTSGHRLAISSRADRRRRSRRPSPPR